MLSLNKKHLKQDSPVVKVALFVSGFLFMSLIVDKNIQYRDWTRT